MDLTMIATCVCATWRQCAPCASSSALHGAVLDRGALPRYVIHSTLKESLHSAACRCRAPRVATASTVLWWCT